VEKVHCGAIFSEDHPADNGMSCYKGFEILLHIVATFHFASETWMFINSVFSAPRHTLTWVLTSLTFMTTTKTAEYTYLLNNCQIIVLRSNVIALDIHSVMNQIVTRFITLPLLIPVIQQPTGRMGVSIQ
jgi:hypothetical protein